MKKLKTWAEVFPQGTKEGDEEQRFFIALSRHPKFHWRSTKAIMKESNLNEGRVEEIIEKYLDMGLIFGSDSREDHWAYWERVPDLLKKDLRSISKKDKDGRIDKFIDDSLCIDDNFLEDWNEDDDELEEAGA